MLLIHYVNMSHFKENENFVDLKVFLIFEVILYVVDLFNMLFNIYILFRAHQFHFNFSCIHGLMLTIHFVDNLAVLVLKVSMVAEIVDDTNPLVSWLFWLSMNVTIGCTFAALSTLFFLIVERCCATFLINDYEREPRRSICVVLNTLLLLFGVGACFLVSHKEHTIYVIGIILVIAGVSLMLHALLGQWNRKIYRVLHSSGNATYSLAERFQVAENIRVLNMLQNIIFYMGLMNVIVVISVLFSSFQLSAEFQLFYTVCLDFSVFVYSFFHPVIMYKSCEKWRIEIKSSLRRFLPCRQIDSSKVSPLMATFGRRTEEHNDINHHFDHLQSSWDAAFPRQSNPMNTYEMR